MAFDVQATLESVEGYLSASGYIPVTMVGHPKAPCEEITGAIYMQGTTVAALTLSTTVEVHTVMVRVLENAMTLPVADIEYRLARIAAQVSSDLAGDYDLAGSIRNIDIGGQYGAALSTEWGHVEIGGQVHRVVDITLPLVVDGSATMVA